MRNRYNFAVVLSAGSFGMLWRADLGSERQRRRRRQDHRHRKTRRHGSAHEGHRHVEGPLLRQGQRERSRSPAKPWWSAPAADWRMWFFTSPTGAAAATVTDRRSRFSIKRIASIRRTCLAMDVNQKFKVITSDQTTHNIHPHAQPDDRQYPVESVSAARERRPSRRAGRLRK